MFAPLSLKQLRENAKFQSKEARENAKLEGDESRKQQLHNIKLREAAAKANQGLGHKEDVHAAKMRELGAPLSKRKAPRLNRQKLGLPSQNPLAGIGVLGPGQKRLYAEGTDTVPAMLTPGEAVIPAPAAQDPKNKPLIQQMVAEGREANAEAKAPEQPLAFSKGTTRVPSMQQQMFGNIPKISAIKPPRKPSKTHYYNDGTTGVGGFMETIPEGPFLPDTINQGNQAVVLPVQVAPTAPLAEPTPAAVDTFQEWKNATMGQETNYGNNPNTWKRNNQGALGLYQLTESTFNGLKKNKQIPADYQFDNQEHNTLASEVLLEDTWKRSGGDPAKAAAMWYGGPKAVDKDGNIVSYRDRKNPNAPDTVQYSKEVLGRMSQTPTTPTAAPPSAPPVPPTGRQIMIAKQDLATSTNPAVRKRAEAVLAAANQKAPTLAENRQNVFPVKGIDPVVRKELGIDVAPDTVSSTEVPPIAEPVTQEMPPTTEVAIPEIPVAAEASPMAPEQQNAAIAAVAKDNISYFDQALAAMKAANLSPEQQKEEATSLVQKVYGDKGIFNTTDLLRFAVIAAGGMLTGGSTAGSLRFAARDTLGTADRRRAEQVAAERQQRGFNQQERMNNKRFEQQLIVNEASKLDAERRAALAATRVENRAILNKLMGQGVDPLAAKQWVDSGMQGPAPKAAPQMINTGQQNTVTLINPTKIGDVTVPAGVPLVQVQRKDKNTGDTNDYLLHKGNYYKLGGIPVTSWKDEVHGELGGAKRLQTAIDDSAKSAVSILDTNLGDSRVKNGKTNPMREGNVTGEQISSQLYNWADKKKYKVTDPQTQLQLRLIGENAANAVVRDIRAGIKVSNFEPYLNAAHIKQSGNLRSDLFMLDPKRGVEMPVDAIAEISNKLSLVGFNTEREQADRMVQLSTTWNNNKQFQAQYSRPSKTDSGFSLFVKDALDKERNKKK
jgi:hypothetical protein